MHHLPQLTQKLQEIFQTDRADLDFGIYRILNSRAEEINQYLTHTLPQKVRQAFHQANQGQNELAEAEQQAQAQKAGSHSEAVIFSHLYTFFSRYYEEG
ncbi:hypothetical protein [Avibacterium avium]|uniref:Uncharacterized protein n=1 Tax=Avibacterium avium TaxID=751 RepID=A0A379AQ65_AVIAV|nr:hypothetical protein [Avibacterium avium]SUB23552.1 Uncharacterised protein [Avibacterium avium]